MEYLFNDFNLSNLKDKKEFVNLYDKLRPEPADKLDEISEFVFRAFDSDKNGFLSFTEFIVMSLFQINRGAI